MAPAQLPSSMLRTGSCRLPSLPARPSLPATCRPRTLQRERRSVAAWSQTDQQSNPATEASAPVEQQEQTSQYPVPPPPYYPGYGPPPGVDATSSSAVYPGAPPGYYPQVRPGQEAFYGYYAPPAPPPAYKQESSSGAPWWIWVGVGVIAANVFNKVQEFMRNPKTPQQMMTEMAMKQMMSSMGQGSGAAAGPFGKAGAMPPFPFPPPPGGFGAPGSTSPPSAATSTVDVPLASTSGSGADGASAATGARKGEKFASRLSGASPTPSSSAAPRSSTNGSGAAGSVDVVEPIVKEPAGSSGAAGSASRPSASTSTSRSSASFFADASSSTTSSSTGSASTATNGASTSGTAGGPGSGSVMTDMMETMLRNPEMQKMLYPYLPEPMRNPQSIEWMLNTPEVKQQMAAMFEQQNAMSPEMLEMMKKLDMNQDKVNQQFQQLGLKPEDVIGKVMSNPDLAAGFTNPKVQAAIMDISQNPMNIMKYQGDEEVMKVLNEVTAIFQPNMPPGQR